MHVAVDLNLNWFLQFIVTALIVALGLHRFLKNTASKYFAVDAAFDSSSSSSSSSVDRYYNNATNINSTSNNNKNKEKNMAEATEGCAVCGGSTTKRCSRCKIVTYCSQACQQSHWQSEHKSKCKKLQSLNKADSKQSSSAWRGNRASSAISLAPSGGTFKITNRSKKILFPYEEFVKLFNWNSQGFPPCGLLNCGNSCFANVVLQCLSYTKPLVAFLLEKGHRRECRRNDWCFLCEFQTHLEKASQSLHPFSPINILSRLPNIGGSLGCGSQEDAHEFMRFAIDTMQSVCLDEYGGEKAVHPCSQETTLIQHIFGGHLQSQPFDYCSQALVHEIRWLSYLPKDLAISTPTPVMHFYNISAIKNNVICTKCNSISNQSENMMDLTVEIQGDAASLEECLDQFTAKEWLHGDNMYKCDRCNDYVTAWKRLTIESPPNVLTIALKRFQSGRFGKLNKRVTFPEILDLNPYMSRSGDNSNIYKLYAVIVHVDMLNASFFGHYICYIKDFCGNWYRVDDCKVARVSLDEVLSQGAYMLLYSRACPRPICLQPFESKGEGMKKNIGETEEVQPFTKEHIQLPSATECHDSVADVALLPSTKSSMTKITSSEGGCSQTRSNNVKENIEMVDYGTSSSAPKDDIFPEGKSRIADEISGASVGECEIQLSGDTTFTCTNSKEADAVKSEPTSAVSDVKDESRTKTNATVVKDSSLTQNGFCGEVDVPSCISTCLSESGHILPTSGGILDGARKTGGADCSGVKLKPLFAPGFLGKNTRNKCRMKDLQVKEEHSEGAYGNISCHPSSGFANPDFCCQNGMITDEKKPYCGYKDESSSNRGKNAELLKNGDPNSLASTQTINISMEDDMEIVAQDNDNLSFES